MSKHHRRKQRFKLRSFYIWHRYMGVSAALFTLILAVTGLLLNHTDDFHLAERYVKAGWILDWYGIEAPEQLQSFRAGAARVTLMGTDLYLDEHEIGRRHSRLTGAVRSGNLVVVAVDDQILLLTPGGELIERLTHDDGVPAGLQRIGTAEDGGLVVATRHDRYRPDRDFLRWQRYDGNAGSIRWSVPTPADPRLAQTLRAHYREEILPLERLLLDLHSGRFFGHIGPWLFDLAAALLILLSLSGGWIWIKRRR